MVCPKGPNKAHRFENHVCVYCHQDDLHLEREIIEMVLKFVIEKDHLSTGVISGLRREVKENRSIERKLNKCVGNITVEELIELNRVLDAKFRDYYCDNCDECDEREDYDYEPMYNEGYD